MYATLLKLILSTIPVLEVVRVVVVPSRTVHVRTCDSHVPETLLCVVDMVCCTGIKTEKRVKTVFAVSVR
jgi:hypothetical protein